MKLVIIAGGKGTRLGLADIPKPMVELAGKSLLQYQIELAKRYGINEVFILSGYLADVIFNYFKNGRDLGVKITHIIEPYPLGTAGSVKLLENIINDDFIVFYGDVVMDFNISKFIEFHRKYNPVASLLVHPNDHPSDSDLLEIDNDNKVLEFYPKPHDDNSYYQNLVNAAVYIFSKEIFKMIKFGEKKDFGRDIFPLLIEHGLDVRAYKNAEYIKDMGTKERRNEVESDIKSGKVKNLNNSIPRKAIFLDRDGVINHEVDTLTNIEDFKLLDKIPDAIKKINRSEYLAIVVTNQPAIAKGFLKEAELKNIHKKMETLLGRQNAFLNDIFYCPHHPEKGFEGEIPDLKINCECRKPNTGMILKAASLYNIDLKKSFIIGDSFRDILCGRNAGLKTLGVKTGYGCNDGDIKPDYIFNDLFEAVDFILGSS